MMHRHMCAWLAGLMPCAVGSACTFRAAKPGSGLMLTRSCMPAPQVWYPGQDLHGMHLPFSVCPCFEGALPCRSGNL